MGYFKTWLIRALIDRCNDLYKKRSEEYYVVDFRNASKTFVTHKGGTVRLVRDTKEIAPSGWFGPFDPKDSTVDLGQEALDISVEFIRGFLEEMKKIECKK